MCTYVGVVGFAVRAERKGVSVTYVGVVGFAVRAERKGISVYVCRCSGLCSQSSEERS